MNQHLLREMPPGYGGVERVAHSIANELGGHVYFFRNSISNIDPLPVKYKRKYLKFIRFGKVYIPFLSRRLLVLLLSRNPLIAHLPCPTILILAIIAKIIRPNRFICFYWHSFIEPSFTLMGALQYLYQFIALKIGKFFPVIVTSPILKRSLVSMGFSPKGIYILSCSLPREIECLYDQIHSEIRSIPANPNTIIVICRLDSYKRVDWLIEAFSKVNAAKRLMILGDGPQRKKLESHANKLVRCDQKVEFYGLVEESYKRELLIEADLLVLPSDKSNEAFGIVQLEAMASGIPALAYDCINSGMYWVSKLPSIEWNGLPEDLSTFIQLLLTKKTLYDLACQEARKRYEEKFAVSIWHHDLKLFLKKFPQLDVDTSI